MSAMIEMKAQSRSDGGKGASRRLRRAGLVPGIVYGGGKDPAMISLAHHELIHEMGQEAFFSSILSLSVDGEQQSVVLKDLQRHPAKPFVLHIDFQRIKASEKIHMTVPIHFLNEDESVGVKMGGSVLHALTELDIACLPKHLPESIDVDMTGLDVGAVVAVSDLPLPEGVELDSGVDPEERVASIVKIEEQAEGEVAPEAEGPAESEEGPED
ncbi:MAG: 50S ribosomal protein L25/general stress protein Ctc [Pseudomonadota bacterium]|nr:50S ribosomal protein L25/general stress protein Ctc [Pseudomonadota bacterium]